MIYFENPLVLLALLPLLVVVIYLHFKGFQKAYARRFTYYNPLARFVRSSRHTSRRATLLMKLALATLLVVLLAGPYLMVEKEVIEEGKTEKIEVLRNARPAVVLILDVSGSMEGFFVGGRKLEAAKTAITSFLDSLPQAFDVGFIAFSDGIVASEPPTSDRERVKNRIAGLKAEGGTVYSYPLETTLSWLKPYRVFNATACVVFATDGQPSDPQYRAFLNEFKALGIPIFTIYIGDPGGEGEYETKLMARNTGGLQYTASSAGDLSITLTSLAKRVERLRVSTTVNVKLRRQEKVKRYLTRELALISLILLAGLWVARYRASRVSF